MNKIMNTQGGFSAFTKEVLDVEFKRLFATWATYLKSAASKNVIDKDLGNNPVNDGTGIHYGWFSDTGLQNLMQAYPDPNKITPEEIAALQAKGELIPLDKLYPFQDVFICDPTDRYYGFTHFDDFFNRRFKNENARLHHPCANARL